MAASASSQAIRSSTSRRPAGIAARSFMITSPPTWPTRSKSMLMPSGHCTVAKALSGPTLTPTTPARIRASLTMPPGLTRSRPATTKDRWLLRHRPHLILDGLRLAAGLVAAERTYVYVSDADSARSMEAALAELGPDSLGGIGVEVHTVEPGYVAGEETAAVRA